MQTHAPLDRVMNCVILFGALREVGDIMICRGRLLFLMAVIKCVVVAAVFPRRGCKKEGWVVPPTHVNSTQLNALLRWPPFLNFACPILLIPHFFARSPGSPGGAGIRNRRRAGMTVPRLFD